jgi:curved DNA-binding protein
MVEGELGRLVKRQGSMGIETTTDYYEILQVSPRADQEIIERAYRLLAKRFHPDNRDSGDAAKFGRLREAFQVLSDPERREAYDEECKTNPFGPDSISLNAPSAGDLKAEKKIYQTILSIFYAARRRNVMKAGAGIVHLEKFMGLPSKELEFHLWYLKEKGWVERLETGEFAITASGVDAVLENNVIRMEDRLLLTAQGLPLESETLTG